MVVSMDSMRERDEENMPNAAFRADIVEKLQPGFARATTERGRLGFQSAVQMEEFIFQRTGSREEYFRVVVKLINAMTQARMF
ncbi:unnamed protein product, partial [Mesorhabditis spiculigera]